MAIRVLLIEHQPLTRIGIRTVLETTDDISLENEADDLTAGSEIFARTSPDVTVLGLRFPGSCSIDVLSGYFTERPRARILILAEHAGDAEISKALKLGAAGYICNDISPDELIRAIRRVASGGKYIPPDIAGILSESIGHEDLTPAEANILRMIVGGMSNKEIAFALDISENTVKAHNQNIYGKLGVSDRTSAATLAIRRGLVRIEL